MRIICKHKEICRSFGKRCINCVYNMGVWDPATLQINRGTIYCIFNRKKMEKPICCIHQVVNFDVLWACYLKESLFLKNKYQIDIKNKNQLPSILYKVRLCLRNENDKRLDEIDSMLNEVINETSKMIDEIKKQENKLDKERQEEATNALY